MNHFTRTKWGFTQTLGDNALVTVEYFNDIEGIGKAVVSMGVNTMHLSASYSTDVEIMRNMGIPLDGTRITGQIVETVAG